MSRDGTAYLIIASMILFVVTWAVLSINEHRREYRERYRWRESGRAAGAEAGKH